MESSYWRRFFGIAVLIIVIVFDAEAYSKYGRKCEDIGCLNSEVCVMEHDPCPVYGQTNECGSYPTCKKASQVSSTQHVSNSQSDHSSGGNGGGVRPDTGYPDGTTSRPRPGGAYPGGSGYMGGQPGSGYPGARPGSGYPNTGYQGGQPGSGYPGRPTAGYPGAPGGYPGAPGAYPNQGGYMAPGGGYPNQGGYRGGYPNQGYPNQGYPMGGGYPNQGGYGGYQQQFGHNYNQPPKSESNSFTSKLAEGLKLAAGLLFLLYIHRSINPA